MSDYVKSCGDDIKKYFTSILATASHALALDPNADGTRSKWDTDLTDIETDVRNAMTAISQAEGFEAGLRAAAKGNAPAAPKGLS